MTLAFTSTPKDQRRPVEREELFSIDGTKYYMPREVPPHVAMKYLRDIRDNPVEVALSRLLYNVIGEKAMNALADFEDLTKQNLEDLMKKVQEKTQGLLEEVQEGN